MTDQHQTRLKVLDDSVKAISESQTNLRREMSESQANLRREIDSMASSMAEQSKLLQEVLARLKLPPSKHPPDSSKSSSSGADYNPLGRHKPAPVHMARFAGTNPDRWVLQANRYFDFYQIPVEDRVTIASFYFDDTAAEWYDWLYRNKKLTSWVDFTEAVLLRFKARELEEPEGLLAKLHQTSSVAEYRACFESTTNRTIPLPNQFLVHCFISGLRADIKTSVLVHKPNSLEEAMSLAQLHEQRLALERGFIRPTLGNTKPPLLPNPTAQKFSNPQAPLPSSNTNPTATLPGGNKVPFRRLSPTEAAQRRAKGLCYHCDEKYTWDHKCKNKPQLLLLEDEPDATDDLTDSIPHPFQISDDSIDPTPPDTHQSSISYNALAGGCAASTLRFQGTVNGQSVQVLLDGGSTHNFVQTRIANFLNLTITSIPSFSVLVGNGERLHCVGVARPSAVAHPGL